jgi:hypothetical protein
LMLRSGRTFDNAIDDYFSQCVRLEDRRSRIVPSDLLVAKYEEIVREPQDQLARICRYLGLAAEPGCLDACAAILDDTPRAHRFDVDWVPRPDSNRRSRLARPDGQCGTRRPEENDPRRSSLYKAELIRGPDQGPWKIEDVELATLSWGHWFSTQRIRSHLNDIPSAEYEDAYHAERSIKQRVGNQ